MRFRPEGVTIHGALHLAARHPANKATVSGIRGISFSGRIIDLRGCWQYNKAVSSSGFF